MPSGALRRAIEQLAQPTDILSSDELVRKSSTSIGETVSRELGVTSTCFGPVASRPVIRGQFGARIQVLSNDLDVPDASAPSEDHQSSVEGILAQRIEIIRGPATMLYGSGASGGLVNVVDCHIVETGIEKPFSGEVAVSTAGATDEQTGAGWVQFGSDNVAVHLDSRSERHPTSTALYANGPHIAVQRFELGSVILGDGILEKEVSTNLDLTWCGATERVTWSVTGFINSIDDYVGLLPTAAEEDDLQVVEYSQFDADFYGFEAETRIELLHTDRGHLHTRLFSDFVYAERVVAVLIADGTAAISLHVESRRPWRLVSFDGNLSRF